MNGLNRIVLPEKFGFDCHQWFEEQSSAALNAGQHIELDCRDVQYLDSSALGMIVVLYRRAKEKCGVLSVANPSGYCHEVFELTNMYRNYVSQS